MEETCERNLPCVERRKIDAMHERPNEFRPDSPVNSKTIKNTLQISAWKVKAGSVSAPIQQGKAQAHVWHRISKNHERVVRSSAD